MLYIIKTSQPLEEKMCYINKVQSRKYIEKNDLKQLTDYWDLWSGISLE